MIFFSPTVVKYMKKDLDIMKTLYSKQMLSVPWSLVKSGFHCIFWRH